MWWLPQRRPEWPSCPAPALSQLRREVSPPHSIPTSTPLLHPGRRKRGKGRSPVATKVANLRKCQAEAKKEVLPPVGGAKGDAVEGGGAAKTLKRGSPGGPKLHPFYPLSQLILVLFLPLSPAPPSLPRPQAGQHPVPTPRVHPLPEVPLPRPLAGCR